MARALSGVLVRRGAAFWGGSSCATRGRSIKRGAPSGRVVAGSVSFFSRRKGQSLLRLSLSLISKRNKEERRGPVRLSYRHVCAQHWDLDHRRQRHRDPVTMMSCFSSVFAYFSGSRRRPRSPTEKPPLLFADKTPLTYYGPQSPHPDLRPYGHPPLIFPNYSTFVTPSSPPLLLPRRALARLTSAPVSAWSSYVVPGGPESTPAGSAGDHSTPWVSSLGVRAGGMYVEGSCGVSEEDKEELSCGPTEEVKYEGEGDVEKCEGGKEGKGEGECAEREEEGQEGEEQEGEEGEEPCTCVFDPECPRCVGEEEEGDCTCGVDPDCRSCWRGEEGEWEAHAGEGEDLEEKEKREKEKQDESNSEDADDLLPDCDSKFRHDPADYIREDPVAMNNRSSIIMKTLAWDIHQELRGKIPMSERHGGEWRSPQGLQDILSRRARDRMSDDSWVGEDDCLRQIVLELLRLAFEAIRYQKRLGRMAGAYGTALRGEVRAEAAELRSRTPAFKAKDMTVFVECMGMATAALPLWMMEEVGWTEDWICLSKTPSIEGGGSGHCSSASLRFADNIRTSNLRSVVHVWPYHRGRKGFSQLLEISAEEQYSVMKCALGICGHAFSFREGLMLGIALAMRLRVLDSLDLVPEHLIVDGQPSTYSILEMGLCLDVGQFSEAVYT